MQVCLRDIFHYACTHLGRNSVSTMPQNRIYFSVTPIGSFQEQNRDINAALTPMPGQFPSLCQRWSELRSKYFTTFFNNNHKWVLYILPYFPHRLLPVGFFLAPGRAEINNTNLILEPSPEEQHPWVCSSRAVSPPAAGSGARGAALAPPRSRTGGRERPGTHSLLAITVPLTGRVEEGKVYNKVYMITFSLWFLKGRLKLFSGLRIIFLYCRKA